MNKRKKIGLLTALPESVHGQRIIHGVQRQCQVYGYDLCVFGSMTHLEFPREEYVQGEANIFNLADFGELDGVILDTATLGGDRSGRTLRCLCERLHAAGDTPACALEMPIEGLPMIPNRNENILREMCRHVIEVHGKTKLCILTGQKDNAVAESRLSAFLDEIRKHGLTVAPEHIVYGDFWYTGGDNLADRLLNGEISMPEAILCASDHMALGLLEKLSKNGVRIPEELIILSFDATDEGASSRITLSSYEANDANSAADAVDFLRSRIEPGAALHPYIPDASQMFRPGMSCGCEPDYLRAARSIQHALYFTSRNYADQDLMTRIDIGLLMESYVLESFTASQTLEECLGNIYDSIYLLNPFLNFFLCLKEDWLDTDQKQREGYPQTMQIVTARSFVGDESFSAPADSRTFPTRLMIPKLHEERKEPSVFYFSPVHFNGDLLGYAVLQRSIEEFFPLNLVYRNWLRFVNNALEMIRSKQRLQTLSVRDEMTGAFNRRGMYAELGQMLRDADADSSLFVSVIDMDGLKYINDTFGHSEGDFGIRIVCSAIAAIAGEHEICVRAGGDEFYLIGVGHYTQADAGNRITTFCRLMEQKADTYQKPYTVTASIGCALRKVDASLNIEQVISEADTQMYRYKVMRKRQRTQ